MQEDDQKEGGCCGDAAQPEGAAHEQPADSAGKCRCGKEKHSGPWVPGSGGDCGKGGGIRGGNGAGRGGAHHGRCSRGGRGK